MIEKTCIKCRWEYYWWNYIPWLCPICKKEDKKIKEIKKELSNERKIIREKRSKKKYREKHKERLREYNSKYVARRREEDEYYTKHLISCNKRRTTIIDWDVTYEDLQKKLISQDFKCAYCGCDLKLIPKHMDHILPIKRGGAHSLQNLHWTCASCNLSKNSKTHEEYIKYRNSQVLPI